MTVPQSAPKAPRAPLRIGVKAGLVSLFAAVVLATAGALITVSHFFSHRIVTRAAEEYVVASAGRTAAFTRALVQPTEILISTLATLTTLAPPVPDGFDGPVATFRAALEKLPQLDSLYAGFGDGSFLYVSRIGQVQAVEPQAARFGAVWRVWVIPAGGQRRVSLFRYLDADGATIGEAEDANATFDPRVRVWYRDAASPGASAISAPYISFRDRLPVYTVRAPLRNGQDGVVGADLRLQSLVGRLASERIGTTGLVFLFDDAERIVAHPRLDSLLARARTGTDELEMPLLAALGIPAYETLTRNWRSGGSDSYTVEVGGRRYVVAFNTLDLPFTHPTHVGVIAPEAEFFDEVRALRWRATTAALAVLCAMFPIIYLIGRRVAKSVAALSDETDRIRRFEIDLAPPLRSRVRELDDLGQSIGAMKVALKTFSDYVPRRLVKRLIESGQPMGLGGRRRDLTILFSDVWGFSRIAEHADPMELTRYMSRYFDALTGQIVAHGGTIDKFIGDAVMAFWNAPSGDPEHVAHGCSAALGCVAANAAINREFAAEGWPEFRSGFGLHVGEVVVGNVGSVDRINYTALGGAVNVAARLEKLTREYKVSVIVSEAIVAQVGQRFWFRPIDRVALKNITEPVTVYELRAARGADAATDASEDAFAGAWAPVYAAWRRGDASAPAALARFLRRYPDDPVAEVLRARRTASPQEQSAEPAPQRVGTGFSPE
jgi:adenylate cyclase